MGKRLFHANASILRLKSGCCGLVGELAIFRGESLFLVSETLRRSTPEKSSE